MHVAYVVRVMRLVSFSLHYNASNPELESLKHDKIWGDILRHHPYSKF